MAFDWGEGREKVFEKKLGELRWFLTETERVLEETCIRRF